jgi:hypothetical protein
MQDSQEIVSISLHDRTRWHMCGHSFGGSKLAEKGARHRRDIEGTR